MLNTGGMKLSAPYTFGVGDRTSEKNSPAFVISKWVQMPAAGDARGRLDLWLISVFTKQ